MWSYIDFIASSTTKPWILMGDFNAIRWSSEKSEDQALI